MVAIYIILKKVLLIEGGILMNTIFTILKVFGVIAAIGFIGLYATIYALSKRLHMF